MVLDSCAFGTCVLVAVVEVAVLKALAFTCEVSKKQKIMTVCIRKCSLCNQRQTCTMLTGIEHDTSTDQ